MLFSLNCVWYSLMIVKFLEICWFLKGCVVWGVRDFVILLVICIVICVVIVKLILSYFY